MDLPENLQKFLGELETETDKVKAAECMLEAKCKELEAAVHLSDWAALERARQAAVAAFEHFIDARVGAIRHLKRESKKL